MILLEFIWNNRANRLYLLSAALLSIVLFFIFKLMYPYPQMVMDSYVYIRPMAEGLGANSFPIGYTWFLQLFSILSHSVTVLVWLQYLLLVLVLLLFYFTLLFFFEPRRWVKWALFTFFFLNPLFFYIGNFIMSDTLFTALSVLWITQLIWMIARPRLYMLFTHAVLLLLVFTVRYNALYYPIFASLVILFIRLRPWWKMAAIALQFLLIGAFILYTSHAMESLGGVRQFSPFGGWKMANNALYMYGHVCQEKNDPVPAKFGRLDSMVRRYFNTYRQVDDLTRPTSDGGFYMSNDASPLRQYQYWQYGSDSSFLNFKKWVPMGTLCASYGSYLVRKYPLQFVRWFIWPNTQRYIITPPEVFATFSPFFLRDDDLGREASQWFGLTTLTVSWKYINLRTSILSPYPLLLCMIHLAFFMGLLGMLLLKYIKRINTTQAFIVLAIGGFWLCDLFFKVTAGGIVFRHQLFAMIIECAFALLFFDIIYGNNDSKAPSN